MKKLAVITAAVAALSFVTSAYAADMPAKMAYKAPLAPAPAVQWTGFYVGLNAGVALNNSGYDLYPTGCFLTSVTCGGGPPLNPLRSDSTTFTDISFTGGAQAGYNWQLMPSWIIGIETDINYNSENQSDSVNRPVAAPLAGNFIHSTSEKLDWFGTFRGRVGMLATPTLLVYGTGGLAYGHVASATSISFTSTTDTYGGSASATRAGWTAGAGAEWKSTSNWSFKVEYLYVDLGTVSYTNACTAPGICTSPPQVSAASFQTDLRVREHIVRAGINYFFN